MDKGKSSIAPAVKTNQVLGSPPTESALIKARYVILALARLLISTLGRG